jgi:CRP-like cAMP-binding protein
LDRGLDALLARLDQNGELSVDAKRALRFAAGPAMVFDAGAEMSRQHSSPTHSLLVVSGTAARYTLVENGDRQITAFHLTGDFVDLHAFHLPKLDHGVDALTRVTAIPFSHAALRRVTHQHPDLTQLLWRSSILDGAIHRQWLVAMGRMPASSHMAHFFCEHYLRAKAVGLAEEFSFAFELTQVQLADALGLSTVHVNRILQELRGLGLLEWGNGSVTILDWEALRALGQFDETYLGAIGN